MFHEDSKSGLALSPKASFIVGLVGGVLVLCTIGFFILLCVMLKGGFRVSAAQADTPVVAVNPTPTNTDPGTQPVGDLKPVSDSDHIRGTKGAAVTLVEFSDFQCPYCQRFHPEMEQLMKDYAGKVTWVYRHFPLSFHPNAAPAANAAECASEQGKFWEFADKLFENQDQLGDTYYASLAKQLGLNTSKFSTCYTAKKYQSVITADTQDGSNAGVNGTPATIIIGKNGSKQMVPGAVPYDQLKAMVDQALQS